MHSEETDLTYTALRGIRKQSVPDAEKLLSYAVSSYFKKHGFQPEADYVETIAGWHEASHGRGMSQEKRAVANLGMLHYIMEQSIPVKLCISW